MENNPVEHRHPSTPADRAFSPGERGVIFFLILTLAFGLSLWFAIIHLSSGDWALGFTAAASAGFYLFSGVWAARTRKITLVSYALTISLGSFFAFLTWTGGDQGSGPLWSTTFPLTAYLLLGPWAALGFSLALLGFTLSILLVPGFNLAHLEQAYILRIVLVQTLVTAGVILKELGLGKLYPTRPSGQQQYTLREFMAAELRDICAKKGIQARLVTDDFKEELIPPEKRALVEGVIRELFRHAGSGGIESPNQRSAVAKSPEATIRVWMEEEGGQAVVVVADDGRGLDLVELREKVRQSALFQGTDPEGLDDAHLARLIFHPGFEPESGLPALKSLVEASGGSLRFRFLPGKFTEFHVRLGPGSGGRL